MQFNILGHNRDIPVSTYGETQLHRMAKPALLYKMADTMFTLFCFVTHAILSLIPWRAWLQIVPLVENIEVKFAKVISHFDQHVMRGAVNSIILNLTVTYTTAQNANSSVHWCKKMFGAKNLSITLEGKESHYVNNERDGSVIVGPLDAICCITWAWFILLFSLCGSHRYAWVFAPLTPYSETYLRNTTLRLVLLYLTSHGY